MGELNVVPRADVSFNEMSAFADRQGWKFDKRASAKSKDNHSPIFVWRPRKGERVVLAHDAAVHHHYFVIDAAEPGPIADLIRAHFPVYGDDEIRDLLETSQTPEEKIDAFRLIAARSFNDYDPQIFRAIERGLEDSETLVRLASVLAAFALGWAKLRSVLVDASENNGSEEIRGMSRNLVGLSRWERG